MTTNNKCTEPRCIDCGKCPKWEDILPEVPMEDRWTLGAVIEEMDAEDYANFLAFGDPTGDEETTLLFAQTSSEDVQIYG